MRLSILLVTYNHEDYILQSLQSIALQEMDFSEVELIVADDCSTDRTLEIIKKFSSELPKELTLKYLTREKNVGITKNYRDGFEACTGDYIAVMEGDDYWTSPIRLKRMIDVLDNNFHVGMVSNNYHVYNQTTKKSYLRIDKKVGVDFYVAPDLIKDNIVGNFSTCMYRKSRIESLPSELFSITSYDWIISICVTSDSYLAFINEPMSVYRIHDKGVWSSANNESKISEQIDVIGKYNELTNFIFDREFNEITSKLETQLFISKNSINSYPRVKQGIKKAVTILRNFMPPIFPLFLKLILPPIIIKTLSKVR